MQGSARSVNKPAGCVGVTRAFRVHTTTSWSHLEGIAGICGAKSSPPPAPGWPREAPMEEGCLLDKYPILSAGLLIPWFANPAPQAALCTGHLWQYKKHEGFVYFSVGSANKPATVHSLQEPPQPGADQRPLWPPLPTRLLEGFPLSDLPPPPPPRHKWAGAPLRKWSGAPEGPHLIPHMLQGGPSPKFPPRPRPGQG